MPLQRRHFLALSSFGAFGLAFLVSKLRRQDASSANALSNSEGFFTGQVTQRGEPAHVTVLQNPRIDIEPAIASQPASPFRFISVADTGTGAAGQYAVAQAMTRYHQSNPYDLVLLAGDNIYNDGEIIKINAVFERPYQALLQQKVKFQACLGNHDIRTANGEPQVRYAGFNMQGQRYYTFRRDLVQFFALDTNHNADWKTQLKWLDKELSRSNAPWKIVFGHHQIYSSGGYGVNQPLIKTLTPLFQKYGVQLYINGHDHNYERTKSINGTTYVVCGAGAGIRPVERSEWTELSASKLSFAAYDVYSDRIEISGIDTKSTVFDKGIIPLEKI